MYSQTIFCDDVRISGTDAVELIENLDSFYGTSEQIEVNPDELYVCSIYDSTNKEILMVKTDLIMATFSNLYTQIMFKNRGDQACLDFFKVPKETFLNKGLPKEELDEMIRTGLYFEYHGKTIVLSDRFLPYMSRILNIIEFEKGMNPIRDLYLTSQLYGKAPFYLTVRRIKDIYKAFYLSFTENCCSKFGETCGKVIEEMSKRNAKIHHWEICQDKTEIYFCFPEYSMDDFEFGIMFRISDTGEYATSFCHCIYAQSTTFMMNNAALAKKNYGHFDVNEFLDEYVSKTKGLMRRYKKNIDSLDQAEEVDLFSAYHSLGLTSFCGKRIETRIRDSFKKAIEESNGTAKGYEPLLRLPDLAAKTGAKEYIVQKIIRAVEENLERIVCF